MDIRFLAPAMTFIGICVSIILWNLNQRRKELSFAIRWRQPLLNLKGVARENLDIRFRGENVSGSELVVIRIFNSGHLPINTSDYQTNLAIVLNPGATILDAHVIETTPADLEERLKLKNQSDSIIERVGATKVLLRPILLNDSDSLTVQLLVSNLQGQISVTGHVQGIARVKPWKESRVVPIFFTQIGVVIMAGAMLGVQPSDIVSLAFEHIIPFIFLFLLGYVCLSAGLYWPRKQEQRLS